VIGRGISDDLYQAYTEKLSSNAFFSVGVTGAEGFLRGEESAVEECTNERFTISLGRINVSLPEAALAGYVVV